MKTRDVLITSFVILVAAGLLVWSGGNILQGRLANIQEKTAKVDSSNTQDSSPKKCESFPAQITIRPPEYDGTYSIGDREVQAYYFNICSRLSKTIDMYGLKFEYKALENTKPFLTESDERKLIDHRITYYNNELREWQIISSVQQFLTCDPDCDARQLLNFGDRAISIEPGETKYLLMFDVHPEMDVQGDKFEIWYDDSIVKYYDDAVGDVSDLIDVELVDSRPSVLTGE